MLQDTLSVADQTAHMLKLQNLQGLPRIRCNKAPLNPGLAVQLCSSPRLAAGQH